MGSDAECHCNVWRGPISIHAPRMGSDGFVVGCGEFIVISIHAPRMGSDQMR